MTGAPQVTVGGSGRVSAFAGGAAQFELDNRQVTITADAEATAAERAQLAGDVEALLRAAFRESADYPDVPRVAPFERVSRSALAGQNHDTWDLVEAVD